MDMLHTFSVSQLDHQDYARDILTPEDHHNLAHLRGHGGHSDGHNLSQDGHNLSPSTHTDAHNLSSATHNLSPSTHNLSSATHNLSSATHNLSTSHNHDWQSPTYSYTTSTPEDSPGVDDLSLGYEFDLVSPNYVTPTLSALISPVRGGGFYKQGHVTQSVGSLPTNNGFHSNHVTNHVTQNSGHVTNSNHVTSNSGHVTTSDHMTNPLTNQANLTNPHPAYSSYGSRSNSTGHIGLYSSSSPITPPQSSSLYSQSAYSSSSPCLTDYISFEYSKNRTKTQYKILSQIHSVNLSDLSAEFKKDNCIYPRAAVPKEQYQGNRHQYETECNHIGWALAQLNPSIRKKRGVIQRAVDSWRNTNPNPKFRSRRVRKLSKKVQQAQQQQQVQQQQQMWDYYR